jgi:hypothetical protein
MRRPLIGGKDFKIFKNFIAQGEQAQGGVMRSLPRRILCDFGEEEDECVRKKCCSCKKQNVCKQRAWEEVVCSK